LPVSFGPRNATFITVRVLATAATAWSRQVVPGGSGIAPSIRFVAGSPAVKMCISSQPVLESDTGATGSGRATYGHGKPMPQ